MTRLAEVTTTAERGSSPGRERRLRALWLTHFYPPTGGWSNVWAREMALAIQHFHDVVVMHVFEGDGGVEVSDEEGVTVCRASYRARRLHWVIPYVHAAMRGLRAIGASRFDVVHAHCAFPAGLAGLCIALQRKTPLVVTEHWGPYDQLMTSSRSNGWAIRTVIRRADVVAAVSSMLQGEMVQWTGRTDIRVVPPVVDVERFTPRPHRRGPGDPIRLLFVGDLSHARKRLEDVLEAVALLSREPERTWHLEVVGDGSLLAGYREQAQSLGIAERVHFAGPGGRQEVAAAMERCDIFVMPSTYETFGVVYIEALASGRPVVATRCGGPEDFVVPEVGRLVAPRDVPGLAAALRDVAARLSEFWPDRLAALARNRFSQQVVGDTYARIYRDIVGR